MLSAVLSDLHLGIRSGADLLRRRDVREKLFEKLAEADHVVLLGDTIELRDGPLDDSLKRAMPFFAALAEALAGRRLTIVPGNHDHRLAEDGLSRMGRLGLEQRFHVIPGDALEPVVRGLTGVEVAYPGLWLRDDVYATHGHYLDCHSAARTFECRACDVIQRARGRKRRGYHGPGDYEAVVAPLYRLIHWSMQPPGVRAAAEAARTLVRRWERPRAQPGERSRLGVPAMEDVSRNLALSADYVVFGHLHAPGRWMGAGGVELLNTGSWVRDSTSVSPGTCVFVPDEGPPRLENVL